MDVTHVYVDHLGSTVVISADPVEIHLTHDQALALAGALWRQATALDDLTPEAFAG